ncbi:MAG: class I SAM-dependent methyltransferase [Burkholderiaceae bacterium]|jgi:predicted O-methyltransferase YrrM
MTTLHTPKVRAVLDRLFTASALQEASPLELPPGFSFALASAQARSEAMSAVYMPISAHAGDLLYALVRASRPDSIVEFGTSFGISTIYLAAAVADNGKGHIYSTELSRAKVQAARAHLVEAGLADNVTILEGDAMQTLRDVPGPIGLALLDGWKDLCLPVLKLIEPRLLPGALVAGDDINQAAMDAYLNYVRDPANGYVSIPFPIEDGMEISCRAVLGETATS